MKKNAEGHQCTRNMKHMEGQIDVRSVVIHNMLMDLDVQLVSTNVKNCHKFGHFSSLCYKKKEFEYKRESSPRAHQLKIGTLYIQDVLCGQTDESSSDESFCLQVKLKSTQAETPTPQLLITNLAYKLEPHKKSQYLRARLDTCSDVNIMSVSVHHFIFKDADCMKLAPSNKLEIGTFTSDKTKVIGSCTLLAVHPDTQCLQEVTFHVTSHKGSVVLSCATTLDLCLLQPHSNLDSIPSSASLIKSKADYPRKKVPEKYVNIKAQEKYVFKQGTVSQIVTFTRIFSVNQCFLQEDKEEKSKQEGQANLIYIEDDKNCQSTVCSDKNCQDNRFIHMWSMTKPNHMQLPKPAMKQSIYKKFHQDDKNCQSTKKYSSEECPVRPVCNVNDYQSAKPICYDKKCQVKSEGTQFSHMWSVPKTANSQIGIRPEVTRKCQDSTSSHCYPPRNIYVCPDVVKSQSNHMQPVTAESKKSQVNTK